MKNLPLNNYDNIAGQYDSLFTDRYSLMENQLISSMLKYNGYLQGSILDIGCGTGLLIDYTQIQPDMYTGIDPSHKMLDIMNSKYPEYNTVLSTMEKFHVKQYKSLISLFGSISYVNYDCLKRLKDYLLPSGRYFLMFYSYNYKPLTYLKTGVDFTHNKYSIELLSELFDEVFRFNDYYIALS